MLPDKLSPMTTPEAKILYENALLGFSFRIKNLTEKAKQQVLEDYSRSLLEACHSHASRNERSQVLGVDMNYAIRVVPQGHIIEQLGRFP
jgi:histone H3/H4